MNFRFVWLRSFRILLFPFSLMYGAIIKLRNYLYDKGYIQSIEFNFPIICIGNISVGGTGKSPMVEYLIRRWMHKYKPATLSRGYKRKTQGYVLADSRTTALDLGDEPMQFHVKFPTASVAVAEERAIAIPQLLFDRPETDFIILDDAFQHRAVKAGLNILLTDCNNLFTRDFFLPAGDLRDSRESYKRAQVIIVTKCRHDMSENQKESLIEEIMPVEGQQIFFTGIRYGVPYHIMSGAKKLISRETEVLLACGIANPHTLSQYIQENSASYEAMYYTDHYIYMIDDLLEIRKRYEKMKAKDKMIIVTEKDAVRLEKFNEELEYLPIYVQPMETYFLFNESQTFDHLIEGFINSYKAKT